MKILILFSAALLTLAGCGPARTNSTEKATITNLAESNANEADITEVPDESADANAAQDVDDAEMSDDAIANATENSVRNATPPTPLPTGKASAK